MSELIPYQPGMLDRRTDSWTAVVEQVAQYAVQIQDTELVPAALRKKPAAITAVIMYGREVGLAPMTALRSSYVINGRVALAAETLRALVLAAGHDIAYDESTTARCVVTGRRNGTDRWHSVEWTLDLARKAGIAGGQSWQKYPRQMLKARATAELCRDLFPDVIGGFEAIEELDDQPNGTIASAPDTRRTVRRQQPPAGPPRVPAGTAAPPEPSPEPPAGPPPPTNPSPELAAARDAAHTAGAIWKTQPPLPGEDGYDQLDDEQTSPGGDDTLQRNPGGTQSASAASDHPASGSAAAPPGEPRDTSDWAMTTPQRRAMGALFNDLGLQDHDLALAITSRVIGRDITSRNDLTRGEYGALMDTLSRIHGSDDMRTEVARIANSADPIAELDALFPQPLPFDDDAPDEPTLRAVDTLKTHGLT